MAPDIQRPTLDDAKRLIEALDPGARAVLRPWILTRFDVRGKLEPTVAVREDPSDPPHRLRRTG